MVEYAAPQISDRAVPFRSRLREIIRGRSEELEALAVEMYARGLSTRDIEALFADERGQSLLSRTAVSEITQRLWSEYESFASCDLSEFEVIYLFVDGLAERMHLGQDDVQNLSHNQVGLAAPNLAELEVAKRNQVSKREPPCQTIHRVR